MYQILSDYKCLVSDILRLLKINDHITLCGNLGTGKTTLVKQLILKEKLADRFQILNLDILKFASDINKINLDLFNSLQKNYDDGKRIFLVNSTNPDIEATKLIYNQLYKFAQRQLEPISYIFALETHPQYYEDVFSVCPLVYNNILYMPHRDTKNTSTLVQEIAGLISQSITPQELTRITELSGGIPVLIRELIRHLKLEESAKYEKLSPFMKSLLDNLPEKELDLLKKAKRGSLSNNSDISHLQNEGLLDEDLKLRSSVLLKYIDEYSRGYGIRLSDGKILINNNNRTSRFTQKEKRLLSHLVNKSFLSRDTVAEIAAGPDNAIEYSEYSIDKTISRLRKKLQNLGVDPDTIKTRKKKGFYYDPKTC